MGRILFFALICLSGFNVYSQKSIPQIKLDSSTKVSNSDFEFLDKQLQKLENSQDFMFQTIDRQWNHFALISSFILGILGIILPLIGFFSFRNYQKSVKKKLDNYRDEIQEYKVILDLELNKVKVSHTYLRKESLESIAESAQTIAYVYRRLPRATKFDESHHWRSALIYSIKSIALHSQLLFESGSEEHRNSVMNMIAGCNLTMETLDKIYSKKEYLENGKDYILNDLRKSFVKYDFEFIHDLRKFFRNPGSVQTLNVFEENLRKLRLYGWPEPISR